MCVFKIARVEVRDGFDVRGSLRNHDVDFIVECLDEYGLIFVNKFVETKKTSI